MFNHLFITSDWLKDGLKELTFMLDRSIFDFVDGAYQIFHFLANATLLDNEMLKSFTTKVYTLLAIIMIFTLAWNLLNYIVDPDKINDKKIGATTFLKDVVISLVLIAISPMIFVKLYSLQHAILTGGVIENLILGGYTGVEDYDEGAYNSGIDYQIQHGAHNMIANVYVAFLYPNDGKTVYDCKNVLPENKSTFDYYCLAYKSVREGGTVGYFSDFITNEEMHFTPFLSPVAGIVLLYFMLTFCIGLAKRVGKMTILQLLAPIPCTLELLPGKKGLRDNWIQTLIKVYCEVFIYLGTIYLTILLISLIPRGIENMFTAVAASGFIKVLATIILIYGLLLFGKEVPKMLCDLLGIKDSGSVTGLFKDTKKLLGGTAVVGAVGAGLMGSSVGRFSRNFNATEGGFGKKVLSGLAGAGSGAARTLWGAKNVKNVKDARTLRQNVNRQVSSAKINRENYKMQHPEGVIRGRIGDFATNIGDAATSYFKGSPFDKYGESLNNLSEVKGILDNGKKLNDDKDYSAAKSMFEDRKTEQYYIEREKFMKQYDKLKQSYAGTNFDFDRLGITNDEKGFMNYMMEEKSAGYSYYAGEFADIKAAYTEMGAAETKFNDKQVTNDTVKAIQLIGTSSRNYDLQNLRDGDDGNGDMLIPQLQELMDASNGKIKDGHTIEEVRAVLKKISKAQERENNKYTIQKAYQDSIKKPDKKDKKD